MKKLIAFTIFASLISCSGTETSVKNGVITGVDTFIDCEKADIGQNLTDIGLTVLGVVTQILAAGDSNYVAKLDEIGTKYGNDAEACAVKAVITVLGTPEHAASPMAARATSVIKNKGWKFKVN